MQGIRSLSVAVAIGLACVAVAAAFAGLPPAGVSPPVVLGQGGLVPRSLWDIWYASGAFWDTGLATRLVNYPNGERVWPTALLEIVPLVPIVRAFGVEQAWNVLAVVRLFAGGVGGALLARHFGVRSVWGLLLGLCPALLQGLSGGRISAGSLVWMSWALLALLGEGRSWVRGPLAGLAMATSPATAIATLLAVLVIDRKKLLSWTMALALLFVLAAWAAQIWVVIGVLETTNPRERLMLAQRADGSLLGLLGWGSGARWGSPVLLLALLGARADAPPIARKGFHLAVIGTVLAMGTDLHLDAGTVALGGLTFKLPVYLLAWTPLVELTDDLARMGVLAWLGLMLVLGSFERRWPVLFGALAFLILAPFPRWQAPRTPTLVDASGPVIAYPINPDSPWSLYFQTYHHQPTSTSLWHGADSRIRLLVETENWSQQDLQSYGRENGFSYIQVDPEDPRGVAASVVLSLGSAVAEIEGPQWPHGYHRSNNYVARVVELVPPEMDASHIPQGWTWRDADYAVLLDSRYADEADTLVWVHVSRDGFHWSRLPNPVAHSVTSLGIDVTDDGEALALSGMLHVRAGMSINPPTGHSTALVITTQDLQSWGVRRYGLDEPLGLIDPEVRWEDGEITILGWTPSELRLSIDPILFAGPHRVFEAVMGKNGSFHESRTVFAAPRLADPVVVGDFLYATQATLTPKIATRVIIARRKGKTFTEVGSIPDISVPFVWKRDDRWIMYAQGQWESGSNGVVELMSNDGLTWTRARAMTSIEGAVGCESPVATQFKNAFVFACSQRVAKAAIPKDADRPKVTVRD